MTFRSTSNEEAANKRIRKQAVDELKAIRTKEKRLRKTRREVFERFKKANVVDREEMLFSDCFSKWIKPKVAWEGTRREALHRRYQGDGEMYTGKRERKMMKRERKVMKRDRSAKGKVMIAEGVVRTRSDLPYLHPLNKWHKPSRRTAAPYQSHAN